MQQTRAKLSVVSNEVDNQKKTFRTRSDKTNTPQQTDDVHEELSTNSYATGVKEARHAENCSVVGALSTSIENCLIHGDDKLPDDLKGGALNEDWTNSASAVYRNVIERSDKKTPLPKDDSELHQPLVSVQTLKSRKSMRRAIFAKKSERPDVSGTFISPLPFCYSGTQPIVIMKMEKQSPGDSSSAHST